MVMPVPVIVKMPARRRATPLARLGPSITVGGVRVARHAGGRELAFHGRRDVLTVQ